MTPMKTATSVPPHHTHTHTHTHFHLRFTASWRTDFPGHVVGGFVKCWSPPSPQSCLVAQAIKRLPTVREISLSSVRGKNRELNLPPHLSVDRSLTQTTPTPRRRSAGLHTLKPRTPGEFSHSQVQSEPWHQKPLRLHLQRLVHIPTHLYTCSKFRHTLTHMQAQPRIPSGLTRTHPGVSGIKRTARLYPRRCMHISAYMRVNAH